MNMFKPSPEEDKLESKIQAEIIEYLEIRKWTVMRMTCNQYQKGIPDLYIFHVEYGQRWVDVKRPTKYRITPAQRRVWHLFAHKNVGVWIMTAATLHEYKKLFRDPNWHLYL